MREETPPGRTRSSRIAFRARLRPSLRPISCPRTSSRASMRCPCVFAGSRDERDLIESSTDTRSSTFRACIRSTENDSRSRERPSSETCTCPSDHRSTARVSTFRGHRLELFADTRARPRGEGEGELTSLLVGALRAGAAGGRRDATIAYHTIRDPRTQVCSRSCMTKGYPNKGEFKKQAHHGKTESH